MSCTNMYIYNKNIYKKYFRFELEYTEHAQSEQEVVGV